MINSVAAGKKTARITDMKAITQWIISRWIADYTQVNSIKVRARYGALEAWVSIITNTLLFVVKIIMGLLISSVAVIGDSVHTLSDTGTSIVILIGFHLAKKPGDREHPFGHERMESIAAVVVAVLLAVAGFELLKSAILRIIHPVIEQTQISWTVGLILAGTILVKELMARFARNLARIIQSKSLEADFWHHRSDALSTVLVLAGLLLVRLGYNYIDGVAGVGVAVIVIYSAYAIMRDAITPLLGERPSRELLADIDRIALSVKGVQGIHDVIVHRYGQVNMISLHIEVLEDKSINILHDISEEVEAKLENQLGGSAVVHIDPFNKDHPRYQEIHQTIKKVTDADERVTGFHDLRLVGYGKMVKAIFDVNITDQVAGRQIDQLKQDLRSELAKKLPDIRLVIKVEPPYAYSGPAGLPG